MVRHQTRARGEIRGDPQARDLRAEPTRCVSVDMNQSERDALVVRGHLRDNGAAIKKAIEGVISDMVFVLQSETAQRGRARV
jgi:hypothetical protein